MKILNRIVSGLEGGNAISTREVEDNVVIEDVHDTYTRFAGAAVPIELVSRSAFHNGFTEDLDMDRKLELVKADIWKEEFGYSIVIAKGDNLQAVNPRCNGVGFIYTQFTEDGRPFEAEIAYNPNEKSETYVKVKVAPYYLGKGFGSTDGFYPLRSFRGLPGSRGISKLLSLTDIIRSQNKIYMEYGKYAEHAGISHPVVKIDQLNDTKYGKVNAQLKAPRKDRAVIIDMKDEFSYANAMAGSWDPLPVMTFADRYIAREFSLNMSQLWGEPMGYLSANESHKADFWASIKEYQALILCEFRPILRGPLGMPENVQFQQPDEPTFLDKMEGVLKIRDALEGLVEKKQIVDMINDYLGVENKKKLVASEETEQEDGEQETPNEKKDK